jgi:CheY-like chemotaxis protein
LLRSFQAQLLLCDLNLPDTTGLTVISGLRSNSATAGTYFVLLTAMRSPELTQVLDVDQRASMGFSPSRSRSRRSGRSLNV